MTMTVEQARSDLAAALSLNQDGKPARAQAAYQRLLARLEQADAAAGLADPTVPDPDRDDPTPRSAAALVEVRARALLGLATTTLEVTGDLVASLGLLDRAERLAQADGRLAVAVRGQRGLLLLRAGRTAQAGVALDRAHRLLEDGELHDRCAILLNRGVVRLEESAFARARADFAECARTAGAAGDRLMEFKARHNLGYVEFLAGNLAAALAQMADAARADPQGPRPIALLDQARVLLDAGLTDEADAALEQASRLFRAERAFTDLAETLVARAEVAGLAGRWAQARRYLRPAVRTFTARGNDLWAQRAQVLDVELTLRLVLETALSGRPSRLRAVADRAGTLAAACTAAGRPRLCRAAQLVELEALVQAGDAVTHERIPRVGRRDSLGARLTNRRVRALAAIRAGRPRAAAGQLGAGWRDLAASRARVQSWDMRTAMVAYGADLADLDVATAVDGGAPAGVFRALERWRALNAQVPGVSAPVDSESAESVAKLRALTVELRTLADDPTAAARLTELAREQAAVQARLRGRSWQLEDDRMQEAPATVSRLRVALADRGWLGAALFAHNGELGAVLVRPDQRPALRLVRLGGLGRVQELHQRVHADLETLSQTLLPERIAAVAQASLVTGLRRLDDLVLAPLRCTGEALVVLPPQRLAPLPWSLLPSRLGLPTVVAPSATNWLRADDDDRPVTGPVAAFAGPGLAGAGPEVRTVAGIWAGIGAEGPAATCAAIVAALGHGGLVHVAAHGRHEPQSPLFSNLALADGPLFAHELDRQTDVAPVVVLSACELGLVTLRPGDQALGWTAVLLDRGARSVTAGVAAVRDDIAGRVMVDMHQRLRAGDDTADALGSAVSRAWSDGEVAPFVCFGAGVRVRQLR